MEVQSQKSMSGNAQQAGFTIVELVVVIIILGILAAAAVPRFLDVSDDAYLAQADNTRSSMVTGIAQMKGAWNAAGRPSVRIVDKGDDDGALGAGDAFLNTAGYIIDDTSDNANRSTAGLGDCKAIYDVLMGPSSPALIAGNTALDDATIAVAIAEAVDVYVAGTDWYGLADAATPTTCTYVYLPEGKESAGYTASFVYTLATGAVSTVTAQDI